MSTPDPIRETAPESAGTNLFQRLIKVMRDVGTIPKTGNNSSQNYKFIEQALMMAVLRPLFVEHGIVILPEILGTEWHRPEGAKQTTARCQMRFTLINADNPAEKIECLWSAEGADMGDKGVNKAGTSGEKYFLMKLLMLSDKDEPDAESVPDVSRPAVQRPAPQEPTPIRPAAQQTKQWKDSDAAPADGIAKWRDEASQLRAAGGPAIKIPDGITVGELVAFKTQIEAEQAKVVAAPEESTPPANPPTQAQIDRLHKLQAALGQPAMVPSNLSTEDAAAKIAELVRRFNAQARDANRTGSK